MCRHSEIKKKQISGLYRHNSKSSLTVRVRDMMWSGVRVSCCLIAQRQQQVLRNVSAVVLKRCNSTAAAIQARPEEWDYAKPFEDIPGPKPFPIIGNMWRFIPYLGNVPYCFVTPFEVHQRSESMQQKCALSICQHLFITVNRQHIFIRLIILIFTAKKWDEFSCSMYRPKIIHSFLLGIVQYNIKDRNYPQVEKRLARSRNHCFHGKPKITYRLYCWATRTREKCKAYTLHVNCTMFLFEYKKLEFLDIYLLKFST